MKKIPVFLFQLKFRCFFERRSTRVARLTGHRRRRRGRLQGVVLASGLEVDYGAVWSDKSERLDPRVVIFEGGFVLFKN